jgi:hypothetical protein
VSRLRQRIHRTSIQIVWLQNEVGVKQSFTTIPEPPVALHTTCARQRIRPPKPCRAEARFPRVLLESAIPLRGSRIDRVRGCKQSSSRPPEFTSKLLSELVVFGLIGDSDKLEPTNGSEPSFAPPPSSQTVLDSIHQLTRQEEGMQAGTCWSKFMAQCQRPP